MTSATLECASWRLMVEIVLVAPLLDLVPVLSCRATNRRAPVSVSRGARRIHKSCPPSAHVDEQSEPFAIR